ncbi:aromatic acid exporter family protein [Isoptericola sp. NPDC019693]|uniref:FUSC family protein n=1 Tax=Isoptericola sp. NPDC019693 TaxID=3364009 RepID=UPI00378BA338
MSARRFPGEAYRVWHLHPRWSLALRGAVAAALAWGVGMIVPPPFSEYPYYAPLGAVVATTSTLARSVRESAQAVGALLLGAAVALAVDTVMSPSALSVALVVGVAMLCAGWRALGQMGTWVANAALFVLILGQGEEAQYVGAFAGLVLVGAAIGVGVNAVWPPLPISPSEAALDRLRDALAEQAEALAEWLEHRGPLAPEEWERRRAGLRPTIERARAEVAHTSEASRGNLRARRHRTRATAQAARVEALGITAEGMDEIVRLLVTWEREDLDTVALGPELRPEFASALRALAEVLRAQADAGAGVGDRSRADAGDEAGAGTDDPVARLARRIEELPGDVRAARERSGEDHLVAAALVVVLRRSADALEA